MKEIYTLSLLILLLIMLALGQKASRKDTELARSLVRLTYAVALTVAASLLAVLLPNESVALFFQTLHYASTEWMLIFLLYFFEKFIKSYEGILSAKIIILTFSALSSVNLLLNAAFNHVVVYDYKEANGVSYRIFKNLFPWYEIHEVFAFVLAGMGLIILITAAVKTISFYRTKFVTASIALIITLAVEGVCTGTNSYLDFALYGYVGLAIFLIYYSLYFVNNALITSTLSYVTSSSKSGVVCFDIDDECIYVNDLAKEIFTDAHNISDYKDIFVRYSSTGRLIDDEERKWNIELKNTTDTKYYEVTFGKIKDKANKYIGCYFYLYDNTENVKNYELASYKASHDMLTGLYSRDSFIEKINNILDGVEFGDKASYIVATDIKDFKIINDLFGYKKGNEILIDFADRIRKAFSEEIIGCRMNSDRFCFFIPKSEFSEEKIVDSIKGIANLIDINNMRITIHFGIYEIRPEDQDASIMYDYARMALLLIRNDYHKIFSYYDQVMMDRVIKEKTLVGEFEKAIKEKNFVMYLQPQVVPGGKVVGAEALVRWEHPKYGMISPADFIPTFEGAGLIHRLDQYMWDLAARKLKDWQENGNSDLFISVNISPKDFNYIDVYQVFVDIVKKYDIDPGKLKLEITESAFMSAPEKQLELIDKLQRFGFFVEIDDFGSGFSSLNMLMDMKADVLKIDMGFLRKTEEEQRAKTILDMILELAKSLNMMVITEGVETEKQLTYLTDAGCDMFQGFYFDRPICVEDFEKKYCG